MPKFVFKICLVFISLITINLSSYGAIQKAIIIGVDKYANLPALQNSESDAKKITKILSQSGYECTTIINADATKEKITDSFIQLEQQANQGAEPDILLVYFSGRGTRIPDDIQADESQDNFDECILPSDAEANNPRTYIRDDALALWINSIRAKQVFVILDCGFFGDNADSSVKGIGNLPESKSLDGLEMTDGLPSDTAIISAGLPDTRIADGVFTGKFLESFTSEEADKNSDRMISYIEAYQYSLKQLQNTQSPRLYDPKNIDMIFVALPQLSKLTINSVPEGADTEIFSGSTLLNSNNPLKTPATISLRPGSYSVQLKKSGFFVPKPSTVTILQYDSAYSADMIKLNPINIIGKINISNKSGEPFSLEGKDFTLIVKQADSEVYSKALPVNNQFKFNLDSDKWLQSGVEYEAVITGRSVMSVNPARFTYDGYKDINTILTVTLDDVPPILSQNGVDLQPDYVVSGDEISGTIKAQDDGLGLADIVDVQLISPDKLKTINIPISQIAFQSPGTYSFRYALQGVSAGKWSINEIKLSDKAGNENPIPGNQIKASYSVFADRFELGKYYFDAGNYADALSQFKQIQSQNDDTRYFVVLCHFHQSDIKTALETFNTIDVKTNYIGDSRKKELPQMPRVITNKIWGNLMDNLNAHRKDSAYLSYMASVAEELGRSSDAKIYRDYAKKQSK